MPLPFIAGAAIAGSLIAAALLPEVTRATRYNILETSETRGYLDRPESKIAYERGITAYEKSAEGDVASAVLDLTGFSAFDERRKRIFYGAAESYYKEKGYTDKQANTAANALLRTELLARQSGQIGSTLAIEGIAERVGGNVASRVGGGILRISGKQVLPREGVALGIKSSVAGGIVEGAGAVMTEDVTKKRYGRTQEGLTSQALRITPGSTEARISAQIERNIFGAAIGASTAGVLGGLITGGAVSQVTKGKYIGRAADIFGSTIDIFEKPGERLESFISKKIGLPENRIRIITVNPSPGAVVGVTPSNEKRVTYTVVPSTVPTRTGKVSVPFPVPSKTNVPVSPKIDQPSEVPIDVVPTKTDVPVSPKTDQPSEVPTDVPVSTTVSSKYPSSAVVYRGGLPLPPLFGAPGEGSGARSARGDKAYYDEVARGGRLFRKLL